MHSEDRGRRRIGAAALASFEGRYFAVWCFSAASLMLSATIQCAGTCDLRSLQWLSTPHHPTTPVQVASLHCSVMDAHHEIARHKGASGEAAELTEQLSFIHSRLQADSDLARLVPFCVKQRGENDRNRLAKILHYQGPDKDTMYLLEANAKRWSDCPFEFWCPSPALGFLGLDPHVELVIRCLQLRHVDA